MLGIEATIVLETQGYNAANESKRRMFFEATGYTSMEEERDAFRVGYEVGREDAKDNDPCKICGKLPAQRAGYAFGYVGEIEPNTAYGKWNNAGRPD